MHFEAVELNLGDVTASLSLPLLLALATLPGKRSKPGKSPTRRIANEPTQSPAAPARLLCLLPDQVPAVCKLSLQALYKVVSFVQETADGAWQDKFAFPLLDEQPTVKAGMAGDNFREESSWERYMIAPNPLLCFLLVRMGSGVNVYR